MVNIRYVTDEDAPFWFKLDRHLSQGEFDAKVRDKRGYVLWEDDIPLGISGDRGTDHESSWNQAADGNVFC